jgi:hypothetical protein
MKKYLIDGSEAGIAFSYPDLDNEYFKKLRAQNYFDLVGVSLINQVKQITGYVHNLWKHDGNNVPQNSDPIEIINESKKAAKGFRCVEYSVVASALLWVYGIPSRVIGLKVKNIETIESGGGHVVIEFWNNELSKWIMVDVQAGVIAKNKETYLSCAELSDVLDAKENIDLECVENSNFNIGNQNDFIEWMYPYLYFIDTPVSVLNFGDDEKRISQEKVLLSPVGATVPEVFQNKYKLSYAIVTHYIDDFYPILEISKDSPCLWVIRNR